MSKTIYLDHIFDDYIISPLDNTKKKGLTLAYLKQFGYMSFNEFWIDYPDFPRICNNSRKNQHPEKAGLIAKQKAETLRNSRIEKYNQDPNHCMECDGILPYEKRDYKFCDRSCSAYYTNVRKPPRTEASKRKMSDKMKQDPHTRIYLNECVICSKIFYWMRKKKSCSDKCYSKLLRLGAQNAGFGGSTVANIPAVDSYGNEVILDSGWEVIIANELDSNHIKWIRPKTFRISNNQRYTPDFYIVDYEVFIDPKAMFRTERIKKDLIKIKLFEKEYNTRCLVISKRKNLTWEYIKIQLNLSGTGSR